MSILFNPPGGAIVPMPSN